MPIGTRVWSAGKFVMLGGALVATYLLFAAASMRIAIRSPSFASDIVVAQMPPAQSAAGNVSLLVNRGERGASYVMPDLIGVNGDRAAELLRARGFRVAVVGSTPYPGVAAGIVIRQSPQAGFQIEPAEPVSLEVSR